MTKSNNSVISEKLCNVFILRGIRYCGLQENFLMTLCLNYLREKTTNICSCFCKWHLGWFRPLTLYKSQCEGWRFSDVSIQSSICVMPFCVKLSVLQLITCLNIGAKFILTFHLTFFGIDKAVFCFFLHIKSNQVIFLHCERYKMCHSYMVARGFGPHQLGTAEPQ